LSSAIGAALGFLAACLQRFCSESATYAGHGWLYSELSGIANLIELERAMLRKSIITIVGGSILICVLLMVFEPVQAYATLGPIDDFPIYLDSSNVRHNGQAMHYVVLRKIEPHELEDFYIAALAKRDWHMQPTTINQPPASLRFRHASITGIVELTISHHHGGYQPDWSEVDARYVDAQLRPVTAPPLNIRWHVNRFGCGGA